MLLIKFIKLLTETEIDLLRIKELEINATERVTRKLVTCGVFNANSCEEDTFKNHYKKYISFSNKLNSCVSNLTFLIFFLSVLALFLYMHSLTYFLYQQGIRLGTQVVYTDSFVGNHEIIWGIVFLMLCFYILWSLFIKEIIYFIDSKEQEYDKREADYQTKNRDSESAGRKLARILIALSLTSLFLAAWGIWTALSTYPSSPGRLYVFAGAIGIFILVGLSLSILFGIPLNAFAELTLKRSIPDSIIVSELGRLILFLDGESLPSQKLESIAVKNDVIESLEKIAACFSRFLPRKIRVNDAREKALIEREFKSIANGFQVLQMWLYTPMPDTGEALTVRLKTDLRNILQGNYHDLPRTDRLPRADIPAKDFLVSQASQWINLLLKMSLPFILLWILDLSPIGIPPNSMDYLLLGSFTFSVLFFVVEIDPQFGEKLTFIKGIQDLLNTRKDDSK